MRTKSEQLWIERALQICALLGYTATESDDEIGILVLDPIEGGYRYATSDLTLISVVGARARVAFCALSHGLDIADMAPGQDEDHLRVTVDGETHEYSGERGSRGIPLLKQALGY